MLPDSACFINLNVSIMHLMRGDTPGPLESFVLMKSVKLIIFSLGMQFIGILAENHLFLILTAIYFEEKKKSNLKTAGLVMIDCIKK